MMTVTKQFVRVGSAHVTSEQMLRDLVGLCCQCVVETAMNSSNTDRFTVTISVNKEGEDATWKP